MDSDLANNKIKLCIVGTGDWGSQVANVANMFGRYDLIGAINSSTGEEEKNNLLENADMVYIAIPGTAQLEYVKFCINNDKFVVCEAPFLNSLEERKEIYSLLKSRQTRSFIINSAYFLDTDFARIIGNIMTTKSNSVYVHCSGPKYIDNPSLAKKFYINQSIFLISQLAHARHIDKFDKFIINNDFSGSFISNSITFHFEWSNSEESKNIIKYGKDNEMTEKTLIYDEYDHIFPILKYVSDQYYGIYLPILQNRSFGEIQEIYNQVTLQSYLISCTAEYFSDIFCSSSSGTIISDPTELFFNAGF